MKTYHIKDLLKKEVVIIETPLNVKDVVFYKGDNSVTWKPGLHLIQGYDLDGYAILGKPDEIREDDAKELVNLHESGYYKDYINGNNFFTLPSKSLLSAIESVIFWDVNPYQDVKGSVIDMTLGQWTDKKKFLEAQEKTFDRSRSIILAKQ